MRNVKLPIVNLIARRLWGVELELWSQLMCSLSHISFSALLDQKLRKILNVLAEKFYSKIRYKSSEGDTW